MMVVRYAGWNSPFYNAGHVRLRAAMREFVAREIEPFCHDWDEAGAIPMDLWRRCYQAGWLPAVVG